MLFDPKWKSEPSIVGFRAWLERQSPEERFPYGECFACPVGKYLLDCGTSWDELSARDGELLETLNGFAFQAARKSRYMMITAPQVLREIGLDALDIGRH